MKTSHLRQLIRETIKSSVNEGKGQDLADKYVAQLRQEFKNLNDEELDEFKKTLATAFDMNELVNEDAGMDTPGGNPDYFYDTKPKPTSTSRVYVLMLGNRYRAGNMGPAMVFANKSAAEAEAAKQEASGNDTRAFVQDLRFIK